MIYKIRLQNFRNLKDEVYEFSPKTTIIVGPNAAGKSNLLESIYVLSTGKSFKATIENELIKIGNDFARVKGLIHENIKLEALFAYEKHKKLMVNGVSKRLVDFAGNLKVVLFAPEDLDLVTSSPSLRRKFLDNVLSLVDREYHRAILSYEKGLRQRNRILWDLRENTTGNSGGERLIFWNQLLIKTGDYIAEKREEFINFVNDTDSLNNSESKLIYDKSIISPKRLEDYKNAEIASATTLVGPHRDDFIFEVGKKNLSHFGSRGEQRMGVLWLKLAELAFVEKKTNEKPTLLLDDIFSELDIKHREIVFEIAKNQQTIITTADPHFLVDMEDIKRIQF